MTPHYLSVNLELPKFLFFMVCFFVVNISNISAQNEIAGSVNSGYDPGNGFFIRDANGKYSLNIGAYAQFRYGVNYRNSMPDSVESLTKGFSIPLTEIFLSGNITDKFDYQFRAQINEASEFNLLVAYLQYNFSNSWNITVGKQFIPLSREDWQYAQDVLGIDFSANDYTFATGTSLGIMLQGTTSDKIRMWLGISNGAFNTKHDFGGTQSELLFSGRLEYQITGKDWSVWNDLIGRKGKPFAIMIGVAPGYLIHEGTNKKFDREGQINLDVNLNGDGYQLLIAGSWFRRKPINSDCFNNYGFYAQGGYFLSESWQPFFRYDQVSPGNQPGEFEHFRSASLGVNCLPFSETNRLKFTAEVSYLFSALNNTIVSPSPTLGWLSSNNTGQTLFRLQAQFGF